MSYVIKPIYDNINPKDPFAKDIYKRENFAENITKTLKQIDSEFVISINAEWGQGKTTFLHMWEQYLKNQEDINFIPIYYDAFKNDFTDDIFLSIAALIYKNLDSKTRSDEKNIEQKNNFKKKIIEVGKDSLLLGLKSAVNVATAGIGGDIAKNAAQKILFDSLEVEEKFKAHLKVEKDIEDFRKCLQKVLEKSGKNSKIVFFIDELDRCRPTFAIEVIEKIKHFFNINNVIFVLAVNQRQLTKIISNAYGIEEKDAKNYFEKFIHWSTNLPITKRDTLLDDKFYNLPNTVRHDYSTMRLYHILKELSTDDLNLIEIIGNNISGFAKYMKSFSFSPRKSEKIIRLLSIVAKEGDKDSLYFSNDFVKTIFALLILKESGRESSTLAHKMKFDVNLKNRIEEFFPESFVENAKGALAVINQYFS